MFKALIAVIFLMLAIALTLNVSSYVVHNIEATELYSIDGHALPQQPISGFEVTLLGLSPSGLAGSSTVRTLFGMDMPSLGRILINDFGFNFVKIRFDLRDFEETNDNINPLLFNWNYYSRVFSQPAYIKWFEAIRDIYKANDGVPNSQTPRLHFSAFCAPTWLLEHSAICRGDLLNRYPRPQAYQEIAELWTAPLVVLRDLHGTVIESTVVWNEPIYKEPLHMSIAEEVETANAMTHRFISERLSTKVLAGDDGIEEMQAVMESGYFRSPYFSPLQHSGKLAGIAYHTYQRGNRTNPDGFIAALKALATNSTIRKSGLELRMTEWSPTGSDELRNHALVWAKHIYNCHVFGRTSVVDLWYAGPRLWSDGILDADGAFKKRAYAFKQYAKFIEPGAKLIYPLPSEGIQDSSKPALSAYKSENSNHLTIVIVNRATNAKNVSIALKNYSGNSSFEIYETSANMNCMRTGKVLSAGGTLNYSVPGESIITITNVAS